MPARNKLESQGPRGQADASPWPWQARAPLLTKWAPIEPGERGVRASENHASRGAWMQTRSVHACRHAQVHKGALLKHLCVHVHVCLCTHKTGPGPEPLQQQAGRSRRDTETECQRQVARQRKHASWMLACVHACIHACMHPSFVHPCVRAYVTVRQHTCACSRTKSVQMALNCARCSSSFSSCIPHA